MRKTNGATKALAARVEAMRAELSEMQRAAAQGGGVVSYLGTAWRIGAMRTAIRAVKRDLLTLETKLSEVA